MTKQQYLEVKNELKLLAQVIKFKKHNHRASVSQSMGGNKKEWPEPKEVIEFTHGLYYATYEYRHKHIVMSLMRGKTREQIEKPKEDNKPNEAYIKKLLEEYATVEQTVCVSS